MHIVYKTMQLWGWNFSLLENFPIYVYTYLGFQQVLDLLEQQSDAQQQRTASYYNSCPSHH